MLGAAAAIWRRRLPERRDLVAIAAFGVLFLGVYSVTLNAAERRVDAGTAAMLINTGPILIAILAGIFLGEGFPRRLFAGCAVAFTGCVLSGLANPQARSRAGLGIVWRSCSAGRCSTSRRRRSRPPGARSASPAWQRLADEPSRRSRQRSRDTSSHTARCRLTLASRSVWTATMLVRSAASARPSAARKPSTSCATS